MVNTNKKIKHILKQFEKKKENYKLYLSGFELRTCDLWFKSQIQSFTNKYFSRN